MTDRSSFTIGLIVNPLAGIGGEVALKGSDGESIVAESFTLGAKAKANEKVSVFLDELSSIKDQLKFLTYPLVMGADSLKAKGFNFELLNSQRAEQWSKASGYSQASDTSSAAGEFFKAGVDILVFAGGDGTAKDVFLGLGENSSQICLGIPAGVKIHSAVYAINPKAAASLIKEIVQGKNVSVQSREIRDIDEAKLREGQVNSKYVGELRTPFDPGLVQCGKQGSVSLRDADDKALEALNVADIADYLIEKMDPDCLYILGGGKTTKAIKDRLGGGEGSLLGIDLVYNGEFVVLDASEAEIEQTLVSYARAHIVVSVIGGQGCIFGRGNQQISANIIRHIGINNISMLASKAKVAGLSDNALFVDTGDTDLDLSLSGLKSLIIGYEEEIVCKVRA